MGQIIIREQTKKEKEEKKDKKETKETKEMKMKRRNTTGNKSIYSNINMFNSLIYNI